MTSSIHTWIESEQTRRSVLLAITQPLTVRQVSTRTGIDLDTCSYVMGKLAARGLVACLNRDARSSRVYWTTLLGRQCQHRYRPDSSETLQGLPSLDWSLYGWLCFRHRSAIMRILTEPMQPSEMKRRLRRTDASVAISANNIRDIIRLFLARGLVQKVFVRKRAHPQYELTEKGQSYRAFLLSARMPMRR
jgi:predicted transcriptional regulator